MLLPDLKGKKNEKETQAKKAEKFVMEQRRIRKGESLSREEIAERIVKMKPKDS